MRKPQLLDVVKLLAAAPDYGLEAGETGTIVEEIDRPGEAHLVEFSDRSGETVATFFLSPDAFEVVVPWNAAVPQAAGA